MPVENISFVCQYCRHIYADKEGAADCEKSYELLEGYKKTLLPWKWYRLSSKHGGDISNIFVKEIKYNYCCNPSDICTFQEVCLFSYNWNDYYKVPNSWTIEEILSPMEMYRKYGVFLDGGIYVDSMFGYKPSVSGMPRSVAEELDAVNQLALDKLTKELVESKSKEELAHDIVLEQHPMLRYNNYLERAVEYQNKNHGGKDYSVADKIKGLNFDPNKDVLTRVMEDIYSD